MLENPAAGQKILNLWPYAWPASASYTPYAYHCGLILMAYFDWIVHVTIFFFAAIRL